MRDDFTALSKPSTNRKPVFAANGAIATSHILASQAGLSVLKQGGSAVDAALAAAMTLTVVEAPSSGVGGDLFALVWDGTKLHALNGSGRAPAALTPEAMRARGHDAMPGKGWLSVTVPGVPAGWRDLHARYGKLPFASLFEPAIVYAEHGFPISPTVYWNWRRAVEVTHADLRGDEYSGFGAVYAPGGHVPQVGAIYRNPGLGWTLRRIAESGAEDFYSGEIGAKIAAFSAQTGGTLTLDDLRTHRGAWVEPIKTSYRGYDVWETPPNGQGLAALIALNILEGFDLASHPRESVESYHLQLEAMKLGYVEAQRYVADPERVHVPTSELLSKEFAVRRRALIGEQALLPEVSERLSSDTTYLCAADGDGMMVSLIQSTYESFGSHVVVPSTGMALQNRAAGFSLDPAHLNYLEPGKRPYHTIIPGFLTHNGAAVGPFGVMGGHMQPQGHVQMVVNMLDYGMDPQAALDAPRWFWGEERWAQVEPAVDAAIVEGLRRRGHDIQVDDEVGFVGRGQIIRRLESGVYIAGSEPRADGCALGY